ncbi:hypothetical protein BDZ94DRAFT_1256702 [Collybia nuda]|uniref:Uncharacterized protein n=1 Tax=Collybia nuda TaxID=64659 RepID=A0A9P5Y8R8_9AGAR|nr:hypothetical protein BDZ94DRAFT_1256702 [Collybia nuda]
MLPYLVGSRDAIARCYPDRALTSAHMSNLPISMYFLFIMVLGLIAGFFVPRLPLGIPRRDFELCARIVAFQADGLIGDGGDLCIVQNMELGVIANQIGDLRFQYRTVHTESGV